MTEYHKPVEHILTFAVSLDDAAIIDAVQKKAETEITKSIEQKCINRIFQPTYYSKNADPDRDDFRDWVKDRVIESLLVENKDAIIERAAQILADKTLRSKAYREKIKDIQ